MEPAALTAAWRSLDSSGLLLLGEVHGARENPLPIRALMQVFGLTRWAPAKAHTPAGRGHSQSSPANDA